MNHTEQRLADALRTVAGTVPEETLSPLQAPPPRRHRRWVIRLAPAFAAAGVALAVVISLLVGSGPGHHPAAAHSPATGSPPATTPAASAPAGPPRYYADLGTQVEIRATATNAITSTIRDPRLGGYKNPLVPVSVAAEAGDRAFVIAFITDGITVGQQFQTLLYRADISSAGQLTAFAQTNGGVFWGFAPRGPLAISPDGTQVVMLACPAGNGETCHLPQDIIVVNLADGGNRLWHGGLPNGFNLLNVSWAPGGSSLVFLAAWCHTYQVTLSGACSPGDNQAQVRTLNLAKESQSLTHGKVLVSDSARYPNILQAMLTPGGASLTMLVGRGPAHDYQQDMQLVQVPLSHPTQPRVLYQGTFYEQDALELSSDSSGYYWLVVSGGDGWVGPHGWRALEPHYLNDQLAW